MKEFEGQKYPLEKLIHVDEFTIGGKEEGKQGRSYDAKKKKTVITVELIALNLKPTSFIKPLIEW